MKYPRRFFIALVAFTLSLAATAVVHAQNYTPDPDHQSVVFNIEHLHLSFVHGRFTQLTGQINYDAKNLDKSSFHLIVPSKTVDTSNTQRDAHLRSKDFFNVEKYPHITFKSTKIVKDDDEGEIKVTGDLTLHGVTKSVTVEFEVKGPNKDGHIGFSTELLIKRSDYGMNFGIGDIGDIVRLNISFEALPAK